MLDGILTDAIEATSLSYNRNYIDIYSCSWGKIKDTCNFEITYFKF